MEIKLPQGYHVYYTPDPINLSAGGSSYSCSYTEEDGKLVFTDEYKSGWQVPVDDYKAYKKMIQKRARASQEWLVIEKE